MRLFVIPCPFCGGVWEMHFKTNEEPKYMCQRYPVLEHLVNLIQRLFSK